MSVLKFIYQASRPYRLWDAQVGGFLPASRESDTLFDT